LAAVLPGDPDGFDRGHAAVFGVAAGLGGAGLELVIIGSVVSGVPTVMGGVVTPLSMFVVSDIVGDVHQFLWGFEKCLDGN
jgi:hypothetical protein